MGIGPSKLGHLIADVVGYRVDRQSPLELHRALKTKALIEPSVSTEDLATAIALVRAEHDYSNPLNSPCERLREHLRMHLTEKGRAWAEPLRSLKLPDEQQKRARFEETEWSTWSRYSSVIRR